MISDWIDPITLPFFTCSVATPMKTAPSPVQPLTGQKLPEVLRILHRSITCANCDLYYSGFLSQLYIP
jgi:hypothetical protein